MKDAWMFIIASSADNKGNAGALLLKNVHKWPTGRLGKQRDTYTATRPTGGKQRNYHNVKTTTETKLKQSHMPACKSTSRTAIQRATKHKGKTKDVRTKKGVSQAM